MSFPLLASLGVRLDKENLYTNLLAAVKEKNLGRDVITNQFVSEINDAMGKRAQGHSVQTSGLMTAKQACHILALMVYYSFLDVHGVKTVYLCICVFVYFHVRPLQTLILTSS